MEEGIVIVSFLPEAAAHREKQRRPESLGADELRICLAGEISIQRAGGQVVLAFHDVPLLGFAAELIRAVRDVGSGKPEASWIDFYGEFEVRIVRHAHRVEISNSFSDESFTTTLEYLKRAVDDWAPSVISVVETGLPQLVENPNYLPLRAEILGGR